MIGAGRCGEVWGGTGSDVWGREKARADVWGRDRVGCVGREKVEGEGRGGHKRQVAGGV